MLAAAMLQTARRLRASWVHRGAAVAAQATTIGLGVAAKLRLVGARERVLPLRLRQLHQCLSLHGLGRF